MENERLNADGLVLSAHYADTMREVVLPYLQAHGKKTLLKGSGAKPLACWQYFAEQPRGTVLVLHGFTESAFKFSELIYSLLRNGYDVCAYDQRGHGNSWRADGLADPSLTHVDSFEDYIGDLEIVCETLMKDMPKPWRLFAHSMGGAVASQFLERHDGLFSAAVLCAPMIAPNVGMPAPAVRLMCRAAHLLGQDKRRVFVSKPFNGPEDFATSCATGRERFDWYDAVRVSHPEYQNNGPTYRWTLEAANVTRRLLAPGEPEKISIPVLLFTAEEDNSVLPGPQERFIRRVRQGKRETVKGARHEIYRSPDAVLFPWWHEILSFIA